MHSVFVVAATTVYREGIAGYLANQRDLELVGSASVYPAHPPKPCDLLVVDCTEIGPQALGEICASARNERIPVLALGVHCDDQTVVSFIEAGAAAYVTKDATLQDLHESVVTTIEDGACVEQDNLRGILQRLRWRAATADGQASDGEPLTARELEVASLLSRHLSNKEIAAELGISVHTVKHHVRHTLRKLGVSRRSQTAAALARSS